MAPTAFLFRSLALLLAAPQVAVAQGGKSGKSGAKREKKENPGIVLSKHSFEKTLTYDDNLEHWLCSAATMPLRDRVQLTPQITNRHGLFWHRKPIMSRDFQVNFKYSALRRYVASSTDGRMTLWLSAEDFASTYEEAGILKVKDWNKGLEDSGLTFLDNRPAFKGVAVVFSAQNGAKISALVSKGDISSQEEQWKKLKEQQDKNTWTRNMEWRQNDAEFQLKLSKQGLVGSLKLKGAVSFTQLFQVPLGELDIHWDNFYLGFTSYTGEKDFQQVDLNNLEVKNFDENAKGEDMSDVMEKADEDAWIEVVKAEQKMIDQRSQKEAVDRLTKLLQDHSVRYNSLGDKMKVSLVQLEDRMQSLESNVRNEIGAISALNMDTGEFDMDVVKNHLAGIKSIITKDRERHQVKLDEVKKVTSDLKSSSGDSSSIFSKKKVQEVAQMSTELETQISSGSSQTTYLLLLLIVVVAGLGAMFLKRMNYYEKKHYF